MKTTEYLNEISNLAKGLHDQVTELEEINPELANRMIKTDIKKSVEEMHKKLDSFSKGVHGVLQYEEGRKVATPSQVSGALRLMSSKILASGSPRIDMVVADLQTIVKSIGG